MEVCPAVEPRCRLTAFSQPAAISLLSLQAGSLSRGRICRRQTRRGYTPLSCKHSLSSRPRSLLHIRFCFRGRTRRRGSSTYPLQLQHFFRKGEFFLGFVLVGLHVLEIVLSAPLVRVKSTIPRHDNRQAGLDGCWVARVEWSACYLCWLLYQISISAVSWQCFFQKVCGIRWSFIHLHSSHVSCLLKELLFVSFL